MENQQIISKKNSLKKILLGIFAIISIIASVGVILFFSNVPFCKPNSSNDQNPGNNPLLQNTILPSEAVVSPTPTSVPFVKCDQRYISEYVEFDCPADSEVAINPWSGYFENMNIYGVTSLNIKTPRYTLAVSIFQGGWGAYEYNPERPLELILHPEGGEVETLNLNQAPKLYTFKNGMHAIYTELEGKKNLFFTFSKDFGNEDSLFYFESSQMTVWGLSDFQFIKFNGDFTVNAPDLAQMISFDLNEELTEELADSIVSDFQKLMDSYQLK